MQAIQEADRNLIYQMAAHFDTILTSTDSLDYNSFASDSSNVAAVAEQVAKIGQAARAISPEFKDHFNSIAWESLVDLEAAIADEEGPSAEITWGMVRDDLPYLATTINQVVNFLENMDGQDGSASSEEPSSS